MTNPPVRLKVLLREKHWQTYATFCKEYDKAAKVIDPDLVGSWPSRAQLHRWLSGELKGLPYPDHCRILEAMLPGWTAEQLFEECPPVESRQPASDPTEQAADGGDLLEVIEERSHAQGLGEVTWGAVTRHAPAPARILTAHDVSDHTQTLGRKLLELQQVNRYSDEEVRELATLVGHVVELAESVDMDIDAQGNAVVIYRFDLLNLSDKPLTRMTREIWFEHSDPRLSSSPRLTATGA
jgi:hypothetical protein